MLCASVLLCRFIDFKEPKPLWHTKFSRIIIIAPRIIIIALLKNLNFRFLFQTQKKNLQQLLIFLQCSPCDISFEGTSHSCSINNVDIYVRLVHEQIRLCIFA